MTRGRGLVCSGPTVTVDLIPLNATDNWALDPARATLLESLLDRIQATPEQRARLAFAYRTGSPGFALQRASGAWSQWAGVLLQGAPAFEESLRQHPDPSPAQWVGPLWAEPEDLAPGWGETEPHAQVPFHASLFVLAFLLGQWEVCERLWRMGERPDPEWISFLILARPARTSAGALIWALPPIWKQRLLACVGPPRASALARVLAGRLRGDVDTSPQLHDARHDWLPDLVVISAQPQVAQVFAAVRPLWAIQQAADEQRWTELLAMLGGRPQPNNDWPSFRHVVRRLFAVGEVSLFCALAECNDWSDPDLGEGFLIWYRQTPQPTAQDWNWWRARFRAIHTDVAVRTFLWEQAITDRSTHSVSVNPLLD